MIGRQQDGDHFNSYGRLEEAPEDFLDYMYNDKSVVLVGPSETLVGRGLGEYIDSFDTIIRMNKSIPLNEKLVTDIGSRTDILYHALTAIALMATENPYVSIKDYEEANLKGLVVTSRINRKRRANLKVYYDSNYNNFRIDRLSYEERIPTRTISNLIRKLRRKMDTRPNSGLIALEHILSYPIKKLFICGFCFYDTFYYEGYRVGYRSRKSINKHHNIDKHRAYMAKCFVENDHVEIDEVLTDIFKREGLI